MIACYHGHRVDLAGLRRRFTVSLKGATLAYLMQIAGRLNLDAALALAERCIEAEYHVRRNLYMPLILDDLMHDLGRQINPRGR